MDDPKTLEQIWKFGNMSFLKEILSGVNSSHSGNNTLDNLTASLRDISITIIATAVITTTVLGNLLVIIAVCSERRLRKVGNSFIVSLAISDLLVGCIVTPLALVYQLTKQWRFGTGVCDFWVSMDVICCTASILNLCVISFDRYNAIKQPLKYALKRTPKRAFCLISFVWGYSLVIALPPFVGWRETDRDVNHCSVSQEKGYTLYSTVGAFFLPLCVMMVLYWLVFQATQKRLKQWIPGPGSSKVIVSHKHSFGVKIPVLSEQRVKKSSCVSSKQAEPINPYVGYRLKQNGDPSIRGSQEDLTPLRTEEKVNHEDKELPPQQVPLTAMQKRKLFFSKRMISFQFSTGTSSTLTTSSSNDVIVEIYKEIKARPNPALDRMRRSLKAIRRQETLNEATAALCRSVTPLINKKKNEDSSDEGDSTETEAKNAPLTAQVKPKIMKKRRSAKISVAQEKRAARTLGIIMGCFVFCWLPFFLVTVLIPFCESCTVHPLVQEIVLWLGYFNSALNPIIYTFFNRDFRRAFKKMLRCIESKK